MLRSAGVEHLTSTMVQRSGIPIEVISSSKRGERSPLLLTSVPRVAHLAAKSALPRIAMVSTHGYVAAQPPLGAADTGGQVVYVLELSKKLALLGYQVDIWTRRFEDQPEIEPVSDRVRIIRMPCGGYGFLPY